MTPAILRRYPPEALGLSPLYSAFLQADPRVTKWLGTPITSLESLQEASLSEPLVVLTGHQPQWLLGPAFVYYKALTVRHLSDLARRAGNVVRPTFWCHSDDSDTSEVDHVYALNTHSDLQRISLGREPSARPLFLQELGPDAPTTFRALCESLPPSPALSTLTERFGAFQHGTFAESFRRGLSAVFDEDPSLRIVEPRDDRRFTIQVVTSLLEEVKACVATWRAIDAELETNGWPKPLDVLGAPLFFLLDREGRRQPIHWRDDHWERAGEPCSVGELRNLLAAEPDNVLPGAILRVLVQSAWFPGALYVGGPNEIAYHVYSNSVANLFGVRPPRLFPRLSVTIVDSRIVDLLERFQVTDPLTVNEEELRRNRLTSQSVHDERIDALADQVRRTFEALALEVAPFDPSLSRALPTQAEPLIKQLNKTRQKIERSHANHAGTGGKQIKKLVHTLRPRGTYQERCISTFQLLSRWGLGLGATLANTLDPFDPGHHLLCLDTQPTDDVDSPREA